MLVYTPVVEVLTVRIVPPEQMRVVAFPDDSAGEHGANRWSRTHRIEGGALTVRREIEVPVQRVARDAYPAFADLVHALEDGARMRVEMRPEG